MELDAIALHTFAQRTFHTRIHTRASSSFHGVILPCVNINDPKDFEGMDDDVSGD